MFLVDVSSLSSVCHANIFLLISIEFYLYGGYFSSLRVDLFCCCIVLPVLSVGFFRCIAYNAQGLVRALCAVLFLEWTAAEVKAPGS